MATSESWPIRDFNSAVNWGVSAHEGHPGGWAAGGSAEAEGLAGTRATGGAAAVLGFSFAPAVGGSGFSMSIAQERFKTS
jgi:hypothetical protein